MAHEVPNIALNNGVEMPSIGLGVFQTPPDETRSAVAAALGTGYRHIDTAAAYGNEREVTAADVAEIIAFILSRPRRLAINEILLRPAGQQ